MADGCGVVREMMKWNLSTEGESTLNVPSGMYANGWKREDGCSLWMLVHEGMQQQLEIHENQMKGQVDPKPSNKCIMGKMRR